MLEAAALAGSLWQGLGKVSMTLLPQYMWAEGTALTLNLGSLFFVEEARRTEGNKVSEASVALVLLPLTHMMTEWKLTVVPVSGAYSRLPVGSSGAPTAQPVLSTSSSSASTTVRQPKQCCWLCCGKY